MRTSEQSTDGPDDDTRALMSRLSDVVKVDGWRFSDLVRPADREKPPPAPSAAGFCRALAGGSDVALYLTNVGSLQMSDRLVKS